MEKVQMPTKPCPKCGGKARLIISNNCLYAGADEWYEPDPEWECAPDGKFCWGERLTEEELTSPWYAAYWERIKDIWDRNHYVYDEEVAELNGEAPPAE